MKAKADSGAARTEQSAVILRAARPDDCETISKLIYELAVYERAPEQCHATPELVRERLFGPKRSAEAIVAEIDGAICGYAIFFHNFSTWECAPGIYLEDVYVRPTYRRRGVGKMFLNFLAALAVKRGCKRFEWAVLDWNKPARDFYELLGARPMDEWIIYRTEGEALTTLAKQGEKLLEEFRGTATVPTAEIEAPPAKSKSKSKGKVKKEAYKPEDPSIVVIHTDGGAAPNPGVGAWAAILAMGENRREISGGELATTNNRMELMAAISALETLKRPCRVEIWTDSTYLKNGITTWIHAWKRKNWRTTTGSVKNADLWKRLDALTQKHQVEWKWLRGHAGHVDNERADELCAEHIARLMSETTEAQRKAALEQFLADKNA